MKQFLCFLFLLILPLPVSAEIYKWVDAKGTVNFTEDIGKVPPNYRNKVKIIDDVIVPVQVFEGNEDAKTKGKSDNLHAAVEAGKIDKQKAQELRTEAESILAQSKEMVTRAAEYRQRLANKDKMSRGEYLSLLNSIKDYEFQAESLKKRYNEFRDKAGREGLQLPPIE